MHPKCSIGTCDIQPMWSSSFQFFLQNALSSFDSKMIPQILHFPDNFEADFVASMQSCLLPIRFITFKSDNEWTNSINLGFIFFCVGVWLGLIFDFGIDGNVTDLCWVQKFL